MRHKGHRMIKGLIHQKDKTILNIYVFNNIASKYIEKNLMKLQKKIKPNENVKWRSPFGKQSDSSSKR